METFHHEEGVSHTPLFTGQLEKTLAAKVALLLLTPLYPTAPLQELSPKS